MNYLKQKRTSALRAMRGNVEELFYDCERLLKEMDGAEGFIHSEELLVHLHVYAEGVARHWQTAKTLTEAIVWAKGKGVGEDD